MITTDIALILIVLLKAVITQNFIKRDIFLIIMLFINIMTSSYFNPEAG